MLVAAGLYWFQPWRLWTNTEIHEQLPVIAAAPSTAQPVEELSSVVVTVPPVKVPPSIATTSSVATTESTTTRPTPKPVAPEPTPSEPADRPATSASAEPKPSAPSTPAVPTRPTAQLLAAGTLISHEHNTVGSVQLVQLEDGGHVLTLQGLETSDGPDLRVVLSNAPVLPGEDGWHLFDDDRYLDLGSLKGNIGDQLYTVPAGTDLAAYSSVSIWCERFSVSFGAAALVAA